MTIVGTPVHDLECAPGYYFSVIVARADDPRGAVEDFDGATLAFNGPGSQSGWAAPQSLADDKGIAFGATVESGGHQASAQAVLSGAADLAALDAVTWEMIKRFDPWAIGLKELAKTPPTPALPYVTARERVAPALYEALSTAVDQLDAADRGMLRLTGITSIPTGDYTALPIPKAPG